MESAEAYDHDELEKKLCDPSAPPVSLPLQFLRDITCNFSTKQELGRGGYGVVYKGVLRCGKIIAVKKIFSIHLVEDDQFQTEARYLIGIKHQNIVKLVGYCAESRWEAIKLPSGRHIMAQVPTRLLCFEYICNQSLDKHISDESSGLDWYKRFEIIKGICSGLNFLHEKRIVHRDLKPGNIVMDATMMPKIADFGLSRLLGIEKSATIISGDREGSLGYMAPEYIFQGQISPKADIFSLGVIIIEIITGCKMIDDVKFLQPSSSHKGIEIARQQYIEKVLGRWRNIFKQEPKYRSPKIYIQQVKECITIALRCVDHDKSRRPNAFDILQLLSAVESTKFHMEDSKDSGIYQVMLISLNIARKLAELLQTEYTMQRKVKEDYLCDLHAVSTTLFYDGRTSGHVRRVQRGQANKKIIIVCRGSRPKKELRAAPNRRREGALQQPPRGGRR